MSEFKWIKEIYNKLGDNVSKEIFMKRLQYSLSGDIAIINEMVDAQMARFGKGDIMNRLLDWLKDNDREVVLFGAGGAGDQIVSVLERNEIKISYIFDNNSYLWGTNKRGIEIVSPDNISKDCRVIIGVNKYAKDVYMQLLNRDILEENIFMPDRYWWLGTEKQYFDSHIMIPQKEEIFVDGGALDGEDTISFFDWCKSNKGKSYIFEPSLCNQEYIKQLVEDNKNIQYIQEGLWSEDTELRFSSGIPCCRTVSEKGETMIKVTSIDRALKGEPVTFIKMDIEGSEMQALIGAKETIKRCKPKLAICVYHKMEDIIEIPKYILQLNPDYKLYLRHYSYKSTETVLYAV